ncbi:MAG: hypothetical protein J5858_07240, partial [Lentisphaeria bacterium]|nr:hypothetical protein [Lentisphaeria bacterium]
FRAALELADNPNSSYSINHELARNLMSQKRFAAAKNYIDAARGMNGLKPDQIASCNNLLIDWYLAQKRYDEVIETAEETLAITDKINVNWLARAYAKQAVAYYYKKDYAQANQLIKKSNAVQGATWGKDPYFTKRIEKALTSKK